MTTTTTTTTLLPSRDNVVVAVTPVLACLRPRSHPRPHVPDNMATEMRRDNAITTTTTLLPSRDNVVVVVIVTPSSHTFALALTPILACLRPRPHPRPYTPDNTAMRQRRQRRYCPRVTMSSLSSSPLSSRALALSLGCAVPAGLPVLIPTVT